MKYQRWVWEESCDDDALKSLLRSSQQTTLDLAVGQTNNTPVVVVRYWLKGCSGRHILCSMRCSRQKAFNCGEVSGTLTAREECRRKVSLCFMVLVYVNHWLIVVRFRFIYHIENASEHNDVLDRLYHHHYWVAGFISSNYQLIYLL